MAREAQVAAKRRRADDSPQRHRDGPPFVHEAGSGSLVRALRVSVVNIRAKQSQFQRRGRRCRATGLSPFFGFFRFFRLSPARLRPKAAPGPPGLCGKDSCETKPIPPEQKERQAHYGKGVMMNSRQDRPRQTKPIPWIEGPLPCRHGPGIADRAKQSQFHPALRKPALGLAKGRTTKETSGDARPTWAAERVH